MNRNIIELKNIALVKKITICLNNNVFFNMFNNIHVKKIYV